MKYLKSFNESNIIENDEYYCDTVLMYHTTTRENLEKIKSDGKLIPTDHMQAGILYKNRLHMTNDPDAHIYMILDICHERGGYFNKNNLYTFTINYPCRWPKDGDFYKIEYKDLKSDNNAGYDGYNFYTDKEIPLSIVSDISSFKDFYIKNRNPNNELY